MMRECHKCGQIWTMTEESLPDRGAVSLSDCVCGKAGMMFFTSLEGSSYAMGLDLLCVRTDGCPVRAPDKPLVAMNKRKVTP